MRVVATLNIKGMPEPLYRKLQLRAKRERRSVAQEVIYILEQSLEQRKLHSILEMKGLGKEVWRGVEASDHVETERQTWD